MKKIFLFGAMSAFLLLTAFQCGSGWDNDEPESLIVGKWEYQHSTMVRTNSEDTSDVVTTENTPNNLTLEIREFKDNGTVSLYTEVNNAGFGPGYVETWDWTLSSDGNTLYLANGRSTGGDDMGFNDFEEDVLTLNNTQLITRRTHSIEQYTYEWTTTYNRR